jgi:hypothetical protein
MVFLRACARGFRDRPRSGVWLAVLTALVVFILSRSVPGAEIAVVGVVAALLAALALFVPSAIHEAHGRWQLRPRCWERDGQWWLEIDPRWGERVSGRCVVSDEGNGAEVSGFERIGDRVSLRFPQDFEDVGERGAGSARPRGRRLVRWTVRQAGNTFEATVAFVWR